MVPEIVGQWRGNFRSAFGSADQLGLGQYQTKDHLLSDNRALQSFSSAFPWKRNGKKPTPEPETEVEVLPVDARANGNGAKPPEENPT